VVSFLCIPFKDHLDDCPIFAIVFSAELLQGEFVQML